MHWLKMAKAAKARGPSNVLKTCIERARYFKAVIDAPPCYIRLVLKRAFVKDSIRDILVCGHTLHLRPNLSKNETIGARYCTKCELGIDPEIPSVPALDPKARDEIHYRWLYEEMGYVKIGDDWTVVSQKNRDEPWIKALRDRYRGGLPV